MIVKALIHTVPKSVPFDLQLPLTWKPKINKYIPIDPINYFIKLRQHRSNYPPETNNLFKAPCELSAVDLISKVVFLFLQVTSE